MKNPITAASLYEVNFRHWIRTWLRRIYFHYSIAAAYIRLIFAPYRSCNKVYFQFNNFEHDCLDFFVFDMYFIYPWYSNSSWIFTRLFLILYKEGWCLKSKFGILWIFWDNQPLTITTTWGAWASDWLKSWIVDRQFSMDRGSTIVRIKAAIQSWPKQYMAVNL